MNSQINPLDELYPMADLFALLHSIEPNCMTPIERPFEKNTVVLKTGEISTTASWMPVGYARAYTIVPGKEPWEKRQVNWVLESGRVVGDQRQLFLQKPSFHYLEYAAGTVLRSISYMPFR